jgi:hypothetical protein
MSEREKTTARITVDGKEIEISADTIVVIGTNNAIKAAVGESDTVSTRLGFFGYEIPEKIFPDLMAGAFTRFVLNEYEELDHEEQGFLLYKLSKNLEEKSLEIGNGNLEIGNEPAQTKTEIEKFSEFICNALMKMYSK